MKMKSMTTFNTSPLQAAQKRLSLGVNLHAMSVKDLTPGTLRVSKGTPHPLHKQDSP